MSYWCTVDTVSVALSDMERSHIAREYAATIEAEERAEDDKRELYDFVSECLEGYDR